MFKKIKSPQRKHTTETINLAIRDARLTLIDKYKNATARVNFRCDCGYVFESSVQRVMYESQGCPLPSCTMPKGFKLGGEGKKNRNYFAAAKEKYRIDHITNENLNKLIDEAYKETGIDRIQLLEVISLTLRAVITTRDDYLKDE